MYIELHCHSAFSFLDGASLPEQLALTASQLGYAGLALTDHNGLYGSLAFAHEARSEEHTSELQSQSNLVCRLLLEKKKTQLAHVTSGALQRLLALPRSDFRAHPRHPHADPPPSVPVRHFYPADTRHASRYSPLLLS